MHVRPLTRDAWRKRNAWAAQWVVSTRHEPTQRPTVLEALISFVLYHKSEKLETGVGPQQEGRKIVTQLAHFRPALLSFQILARSELFLTPPYDYSSAGIWLQKLGFGTQIRFSLPIELPLWTGEARACQCSKRVSYDSHGDYVWRPLEEMGVWQVGYADGWD